MSVQNATVRLTVKDIRKLYEERTRLSMLTSYDAVMAQLVDRTGCEMILVGDSVGNTVLGYENTIPVTLEDMIRHTSAVVRGSNRALVILDLPFGTTTTPEVTLASAVRALKESGCQAVKLEGGASMAPTISKLTQAGIPVMAHIGLMPQSIHQLGGYSLHGKTEEQAKFLMQDAMAIQAAGAFSVVLECVVPAVAEQITATLKIPTIGIGSGNVCSGEVRVIHDLIGLSTKPAPKFAKPMANVAQTIEEVARGFVEETRGKTL